MSEEIEVGLEAQSGPPASNLRKTGARSTSTEINMASMSDKYGSTEGLNRISVKKQIRKAKTPKPNGSTPSVREWLSDTNETDIKGNVFSPLRRSYTAEWSMTRQGYGSQESLLTEDGLQDEDEDAFAKHKQPVEEWTEDEDDRENERESQVEESQEEEVPQAEIENSDNEVII